MFKFEKQFKIKVIYKSGQTHNFWVTEFLFDGVEYKWKTCTDANRPIDFGGAEVAAVWCIGYRLRPAWK